MSDNEQISDEILNAFVDRELDREDILEVQRLILKDADVRRRVDELRSLKSLLKASYPPVADENHSWTFKFDRVLRYGLAACVLLVVGALIGGSFQSINQPAQNDASAARFDQKPENTKVLFHINRDDPGGFQQVLNQVQSLLEEYQGRLDQLHIEIVANGAGLNLYRAENARFADSIKKLRESYNNVAFIGCQNTYDRLSREYGETFFLMPEINMVKLGISHVLQRQRAGWAYIQA